MTDLPAIAQLKRSQKWVAWKYVVRDGRKTKPPINPHNGRLARNNKPADWGSWDEAVARVQRDGLAGVGYVLTEDDGLTGIDLDHVRDPATGHLEPWAAEIVELAETYAEVSPSGTGIRIFCQGKIEKATASKDKGVEMYGRGRYLTITANHVAGTPESIEVAPKTIAALRARVHGERFEPVIPQYMRDTIPIGRGTAQVPPSKWQALNSEALANLAKWIPNLFPGVAPTADGRYRITSKMLGRDLEEDLSISRDGIKDFGLHDMGDPHEGKRTPLDLVMEWSNACKGITDDTKKLEVAYDALSETLGRKKPETVVGNLLQSSAEFVRAFVPPDYLIDGLLQRRFLYSFTGSTGAGKTSVAMRIAAHVALGLPLTKYAVEPGRVLFFAGENPDDVRMRWIKLCEEMKADPDDMDVCFLPGTPPIGTDEIRTKINTEVAARGPVALVIVDTSAAYFRGDDENSRTQLGNHARMLRTFVNLPGGPTVIVTCHPTKAPNVDNLLPAGGGSFLNEVDGNLVCSPVVAGTLIDLHWHGKFRGPDFEPIAFKVQAGTTEKLKDSKGRSISTVTAIPISDAERSVIDDARRNNEIKLLALLNRDPGLSLSGLAEKLNWFYKNGDPNKSLVNRMLIGLRKDKLIEKGNKLTPSGKQQAQKVIEM